MMKKNQNRLILASASPRRKALLEKAGLDFVVVPSNIPEDPPPQDKPEEIARHLALAKARYVAGLYPQSWVIGADTIVVAGGQILGKPNSSDDAKRMLHLLSGRLHIVITGYCVMCMAKNSFAAKSISTTVGFEKLSKEKISWYVETGEPFGKAGAYAIQGLGACLVSGITGSYTNVMGLPVREVVETLIDLGVLP